jgi:hypothetical protein
MRNFLAMQGRRKGRPNVDTIILWPDPFSADPSGELWEENEVAKLYPRLARKYNYRG